MSHKKSSISGAGSGVNLGLIITPMLDMAFQLLAFFIMTYHPSALEGYINGKLLPPAKLAKGKAPEKAQITLPSADIPPEDTESLLVFIKAVPKGQKEGGRTDGEPRWLEIRRKEATSTLSGDTFARDLDHFVESLEKELDTELKKIMKEPGSNTNLVRLEADPDLKHQYMMRIYDTCKKAGFGAVSFVSPPLEVKK